MITIELLKEWNACSDGIELFAKHFPNGADLQTAIEKAIELDRDDDGFWLFKKCRDNGLYLEVTAKGYSNSGHRNSGHSNSGGRNSGDSNSGHSNSGGRNSGDSNSGHSNSGHSNSGGRNSGNWNSGYMNSGFFNTDTPSIIKVFNKDCDRSAWEISYKPDCLYFDLTYWVDEHDMTDEEKSKDPDFYVRGGQLRTRDYKEAFKASWDNADTEDRIRVKELPNFDAELFYEISGIDLRGEGKKYLKSDLEEAVKKLKPID